MILVKVLLIITDAAEFVDVVWIAAGFESSAKKVERNSLSWEFPQKKGWYQIATTRNRRLLKEKPHDKVVSVVAEIW